MWRWPSKAGEDHTTTQISRLHIQGLWSQLASQAAPLGFPQSAGPPVLTGTVCKSSAFSNLVCSSHSLQKAPPLPLKKYESHRGELHMLPALKLITDPIPMISSVYYRRGPPGIQGQVLPNQLPSASSDTIFSSLPTLPPYSFLSINV